MVNNYFSRKLTLKRIFWKWVFGEFSIRWFLLLTKMTEVITFRSHRWILFLTLPTIVPNLIFLFWQLTGNTFKIHQSKKKTIRTTTTLISSDAPRLVLTTIVSLLDYSSSVVLTCLCILPQFLHYTTAPSSESPSLFCSKPSDGFSHVSE